MKFTVSNIRDSIAITGYSAEAMYRYINWQFSYVVKRICKGLYRDNRLFTLEVM